jgi:hypothetical protein
MDIRCCVLIEAGKRKRSNNLTMKLIYLIFLSLLLTGCLKANIAPAPVPSKSNVATIKMDSLGTNAGIVKGDTLSSHAITGSTDTANDDYWFNGTKGTALIQVTCKDCNAIATIGDVSIPFLFNDQGVGQLKYTPAPGLSIYIAVCPGGNKAIEAEIFDAAKTSLYTYSGVGGNWSDTYTIK